LAELIGGVENEARRTLVALLAYTRTYTASAPPPSVSVLCRILSRENVPPLGIPFSIPRPIDVFGVSIVAVLRLSALLSPQIKHCSYTTDESPAPAVK